MIDFFLSIFSSVLQMDMRDHHNIPFALPLVMGSFLVFIIGFIILKFIGNEEKLRGEDSSEEVQNRELSQ
jgi:Na+/H+ antiporter NhaA